MVRIYFTSDLHGFAFPVNFKSDKNTLIIDGGDILQGSPLTQYCHRVLKDFTPIAEIVNKCGYNFITLGNHDFNFGLDALYGYINKLNARCLCENITAAGTPVFPYTIQTLDNGIKVGLVGVVTDFVNLWEKPENLAGITITDTFNAAKQANIKLKGKVDLQICVYHGGFERDLETGRQLSTSTENIGCKICEELDFDILLTGHQHAELPGRYYHGTYIIQPQENGKSYACLDVCFENDKKIISSKLCSGEDFSELPIPELIPELEVWLDEEVGQLEKPLTVGDKVEMALNGSALADFFNHIQLSYSGAQLSATCLSNDAKGLPEIIKRSDIFAAYPYPNTFFVLEINGNQLKTALERSAEYLDFIDGRFVISDSFLKPKIAHYNYDFFAGIEFEVDYSKPKGSRVKWIKYNETEVTDEDTFTICVNNYRAAGGGDYPMYPLCPVVKEINMEMTDMLLDYFD